MIKVYAFFTLLLLSFVSVSADSYEAYDGKTIASIKIRMETLRSGQTFDQSLILEKMKTKTGDPFSQTTFDQDLKTLSEEYDRVIPIIERRDGQLTIFIKLWEKPVIRSVKWNGNKHIKTSKLQKELGIKLQTVFNRDEFNKAFNKVKEFYVKRGFFEARLDYTIVPQHERNEVDIVVNVNEGRSGRIQGIKFTGFTKKEQSDILEMINTKKYNFLTSWLTGRGIYHEEALSHDKLIIIDYLQNQGFADAKVDIDVHESAKTGQIIIELKADRGEVFHFGDITFSGNQLYNNEKIEKALAIKNGDVYSPEKMRDAAQRVRDLYGKDGYIEANVHYTQSLSRSSPLYNIHYDIEENEQYRVGLIRVLGNSSTNTSVILRESLLVPGEVFDSRKLKATERRLEAVGYFKSVNVYAVKSSEDASLGSNYRDVVIEVEETTTGSASLFFGASSINRIFGGLDFSENNFDISGLLSFWREGMSVLRGAGEYFHAKLSIGAKERSYNISWLDPYFLDSLWRFGFDASYNHSKLQSNDYDINTVGGSLFASYPLTQFWTTGSTFRLKNANIHVNEKAGQEARNQQQNSGLITGLSGNLSYDSTNSPYKPSRGIRSNVEAEIAGVRRHADKDKSFPFARFAWNNALYYSPWAKGTFKVRGEFRYIYPFGLGTAELLPISERFFLGGETTIRGYRSFSIGPKYTKQVINNSGQIETQITNDPTGGISSSLFSIEYLQRIIPLLDAFIFFDSGSISLDDFDIGRFKMAYGAGLRLEIGNRMPLMIGYGLPINPDSTNDIQKFFFAMGAQF